jgi:hypothetical protein
MNRMRHACGRNDHCCGCQKGSRVAQIPKYHQILLCMPPFREACPYIRARRAGGITGAESDIYDFGLYIHIHRIILFFYGPFQN